MADEWKTLYAVDNPEKILQALKVLMRDCERLMKLIDTTEATEIVITKKGPGE